MYLCINDTKGKKEKKKTKQKTRKKKTSIKKKKNGSVAGAQECGRGRKWSQR